MTTEHTKDTHQSLTKPSPEEGQHKQEEEEEEAAQQQEEEEEEQHKQEEEEEEQHKQEEEEEEEEEAQQQEEEEEPVSPVLDLNSSLDLEVMELMDSSPPPSLLHLSSPSPVLPRRGKGRALRPPPFSSSGPTDDLSLRLRMSPFSTEASPETSPTRAPGSPLPLSPPSPPLRESPPLSKFPAPPSTLLPLTPKIGMGKPAITKRKFSPGRVRLSRQGSWWSNHPSSSQDSTGEGGWDSPKPHPPESPVWSIRVGRGSGFPGKRRSRGGGAGTARGGRGRSRLKIQESLTLCAGGGNTEPFQAKEEEENSMHNTVVMFSTSDHFTLKQDMCVVCGSFGQGAEGRLLACSQCGQCYHPYCVNVKITRVILTKGWRCLECTVCEACGEASDPGRLLLCDDCDISYHTYCLDPPLHTVPKGAWKCKWCVWCVQCGSTSPGLHSEWQSNYSRCGPCCSLSRCPLCQRAYSQDELVLQCQQCDRWVHASCQGLSSEDDVEFAAEEGFECSLCRTHSRSSQGTSESLGPFMAQIVSRTREPETRTYTQDGVCLTELGLSHLQSLVEPLTSPRRDRRCKPKLKLRIINQNSVSVLQTPETELQAEQDPRGDLECDMKSDSSPERDHAHNDEVAKEPEVADGNKKRKRKPYRPGIGGFMVRQRGGKSAPGRIKLCGRESIETLPGPDEGLLDGDVSMETVASGEQNKEKVKKRYRKKKTKLEEAFPSYLQDAFFGRDLLDLSRQLDGRTRPETPGGQSGPDVPPPSGPLAATIATSADRKPATLPGLDSSSVSSETPDGGGRDRPTQDEHLDAILSPELDKMVSDGDILSKLHKIPELEGKDVEEVFTAVLSPNCNIRSEQNQHTTALLYHRLPLMNGLVPPAAPPAPPPPAVHSGAPGLFRAAPGSAPGPDLANQASEGCGEQDPLSTAQRAVLKWEKEESLGEQASVAPVLYCNTNFPQLREQYPDPSIRMKQIAKLWRKASSQDRAPYVQKARDNRAAQRISKVSTTEPLKRPPQTHLQAPLVPPLQSPPQSPLVTPLQTPPTFDPSSMDLDMSFKDPLRPKESEQEQEWKFRQQMRQKSKQLAKLEACQKLEQVKNEQLQQRQRGRLSPETSPSGQQQLQQGVFLRPPPSPLRQPPFSPPSSRPSSPWDPYRPASSQTGGAPGLQRQNPPNPPGSSPQHHPVLVSPTPSPDAKTAEVCRSLRAQPGLQQTRSMMSPSSGFRSAESFQRTSVQVVSGSESYLVQGGVFKAPMPPLLQPQQEVLGSPGGGRRDPCRPSDLGQEPAFPSSPHRSPFGTPRPDPDPPGPPRPHADPAQIATPPFHQPSVPHRPSPSHPDPYASAPGTPRPPARSPGNTPGPSSSPLGPGRTADQEAFSRTPAGHAPAGHAPAGHAPGHESLELVHPVTGEMSPLDGPIGVLPQIGDSEEKLRQRQRLRQLILRQQQQKNALRQEAGPGPGPGPAAPPGPGPAAPHGPGPGSAPPLHSWTQENSGPAAHPAGLFGRPPPPYPGGPVLSFPIQNLPQNLRLAPPPGLQESFLRPPQGAAPTSVPVHMRPAEFTGIRPPPTPPTHLLTGLPQPLPPRSLPLQQHSIMGRPYIELRHRLRLPLPPVAPPTATRTGGLDQLSQPDRQQDRQALGPGPGPGPDPLLPGPGGMEEHLEDSAVKDLEDVEVKDLVDLNLNLDPDDGKEDLDLHLDDFLLSGKFDLIAYADPELDLEDKKDMFNEELDLGEPSQESRPPGPPGPPRAADVPSKAPPSVPVQDQTPPSVPVLDQTPPSVPVQSTVSEGPLSMFQQRPLGLSQTSSALLTSPQDRVVLHSGPSTQSPSQNQNQNKSRPLLLEEQPLLLQDLLDQERQEQQQHQQMQALIRQESTTDPPGLSSMDPIMKAKMVALKGINKVMSQGTLSLNRFQHPAAAPGTQEGPVPLGQDVKCPAQLLRPVPPSSGACFVNESQRRQYEEWLGETQRLLQMQQRLLEEQITAHRKAKKALSAKHRTARRAGRAVTEEDAAQLRSIGEQQAAVQRQLEQIRKQQKDHAELIEDYHSKQQQRALQQPLAPPTPQTHLAPPTPQTHIAPPTPQTHMAQLTPQTHMAPPTPQTHIAPPTPQTRMATPTPQTHLATPTPQTHLATPTPHTHLAPPSPHTHLAPPSPHTHLAPPTPQTHLAPPTLQTHLAPPSPRTHLAPPSPRTHLAPPSPRTHLAPPSPHTHVAPPTPQTILASPSPQTLLAPPSPQARLAPPSPQARLAPPSPQARLAPPSPQAHLAPPSPQTQLAPPNRCPHPGGPVPVWAPGMVGQRTPLTQATPPHTPTQPSGSTGDGITPKPQVKFDDNNPFSEGFQERERRERLREQQERQRVQLLQEVERHRALQQRLDLEQQGLLGASGAVSASRVGQTPSHPGPGGPPGSVHVPGEEGLTQMPFFSSDLPQDFLQSLPGQAGAPCPQQSGPPAVPALTQESRPRPPGPGPAAATPSHPGVQRRGQESSPSPSPSPSSGGPASLLRLYSDVIPEDNPKKKRSRRRDGHDAAPLSDITSCSTPTRGSLDQSEASFLLGLAPSSELERQLSFVPDGQRRPLEVKEEREEGGACGGGVVKMEDGLSSSPLQGGDGGKELLRHLLRDKMSPSTTPPPAACRQLSTDGVRSEEEDWSGSHGNTGAADSPDAKAKLQRCKRAGRPDRDRAPPKHKRRRREEEEKSLNSTPCTTSGSDPPSRQLAVLPLMEPVLGVDLGLFPPFGSSSLGTDSRLSGSFGNGNLDGVTDFYSHLIYKQNNLSNPPTPPASLPPTPPPVARQKLLNGFATTDELKDMSEHDVKGVSALKQKGEELLPLSHASKTVDVPASLPTPPHNNQEELRVHSLESFVPSSSPESVVDAEISRYPDLSSVKLEAPSPCASPTFPITPCAWGKVKQEVKAEPVFQAPPSCSSADLVTIAITLNPVASQNVPGVMAAVAQLLRISVPPDYQLSPGDPHSSMMNQSSTSCRLQRPGAVRMNLLQHCSFCKVPLGNRVQVVRELKQEAPSRPGPGPGPGLVFCSPGCSEAHRSSGDQRSVPVVAPGPERPPPRALHHYANNMSSIPVQSLLHSAPPPSSSPPPSFPPASAVTMETKPPLKVKVKLKPRPRAVPGGDDLLSSRYLKRARSPRWRRWSVSIALSRGPCVPNEAVAVPTEEEIDVLLQKLGTCLRPDPLPRDQRRCCFCHQQGDGRTDGPARLLNLDLDLWVHLNCALWSSEVYETQAGALINVELALRRGLTLRCVHCQRTGATSGCNRLRCTNTYHFTCALQASCTFFKDKTMLCPLHKPRSGALSGSSPSSAPGLTSDPAAAASCDPYDSELRCFAVFRRVFVQRDEARQIAAVVQRGERQHTFRVGALLFRAVGRLLPQQMSRFHSRAAIFPAGYHANRLYWSMRHSNRRCKYMCYIEEKDGQPLFKVKVVERGHEDLVLTGDTPKAVWDQVLEPLSHMRTSSGTLKLFPVYLKGEDLFGLTTSAVTRIIESLPGVEACDRYSFRFGRNPLMEWPLAFNPSGSARSEPKTCQAKRAFLLGAVAPRCQGSVGSIVGLVPGVVSLSPGESVAGAHQGRHSKSSQYRRMKAEWKTNVYLARSRIQGLGLYAARDIEKCTMVIEYIGTIIRSEVANRKERLYESQNRGVYMFRIDNDYVIDATITGGPARYINHSCAPNCITEVVTVEKENKIIISSCRRIQRGEELSYDYKFDLEDDQHKIPCHCGAVNCRKWMN